MRLPVATSNADSSPKGGRGGRRFAPLAFTDHGFYGTQFTAGHRAEHLRGAGFCEAAQHVGQQPGAGWQVYSLERKVLVHERNIAELVDSMAELLAAPPARVKRPIGFVHPKDGKDADGKDADVKAAAKGRKG